MSSRKNINGIKVKQKLPETRIQERPLEVAASFHVTEAKKLRKKRSLAKLHFPRKLPFILFVLASIILLSSYFNRTTVVITPYSESHGIDTVVSAQKKPSLKELGFDIIALEGSEELSLESSGLREVQEQASATIRIFNDYSTTPQRLVEETRFETPEGKIYMLAKGDGVLIPGKQGDTPGTVDVKVFAQEVGEEYNGGLTDLSIPGFKELGLDKKYASIYARSLTPFTGGGIRLEPVVSSNQKDQAEHISQGNLALKLQDMLEREKTDDFIIIEGSERIDLHEMKYVGEKKKEHLYEQKGMIYALIVRKEELKKFLIADVIDPEQGESISVESLGGYRLSYTGPEIDYEGVQSIPIHLELKPIFVWHTDADLLKTALSGLKKDETKAIFNEFPSIASAELKIRPFWKKRVSRDPQHIKVK